LGKDVDVCCTKKKRAKKFPRFYGGGTGGVTVSQKKKKWGVGNESRMGEPKKPTANKIGCKKRGKPKKGLI